MKNEDSPAHVGCELTTNCYKADARPAELHMHGAYDFELRGYAAVFSYLCSITLRIKASICVGLVPYRLLPINMSTIPNFFSTGLYIIYIYIHISVRRVL